MYRIVMAVDACNIIQNVCLHDWGQLGKSNINSSVHLIVKYRAAVHFKIRHTMYLIPINLDQMIINQFQMGLVHDNTGACLNANYAPPKSNFCTRQVSIC